MTFGRFVMELATLAGLYGVLAGGLVLAQACDPAAAVATVVAPRDTPVTTASWHQGGSWPRMRPPSANSSPARSPARPGV